MKIGSKEHRELIAIESHHHHGPSTLPKLAKCIHFVGKGSGSEAATRGTMLHEQIANRLNFSGSPSKAPHADAEAIRGVERLHKLIDDIRGVEQTFSLIDDNLNELNFGTIDAWGYDNEGEEPVLTIVDFKSGRMASGAGAYTEQLACYALMLMDAEGVESCKVVIIPIDDEETEYHVANFTYHEAADIVMPIFQRLKEGTEEPRENDGCAWCAKREGCPVWVKPAEATLTLVDAMPATLSREWIEASPQNAGIALTAFKKLEAIFDDLSVKDRIKSALESGEKVDGWKLQAKKGAERLDTKAVKARWVELTDEPIPATIGEDSVSLVAERRSK